jgi:hypothetical protein
LDYIKQEASENEPFDIDDVPDEDDFLDENGMHSSSIVYKTYNTSSLKQSNIGVSAYGSLTGGQTIAKIDVHSNCGIMTRKEARSEMQGDTGNK